jgi:hypothetical protein
MDVRRSVHLILLGAGMLTSQTVLPLAHEWRVAREESAHHAADPEPDEAARVRAASSSSDHRHHDSTTCPVEIFLGNGRFGTAPGSPPCPVFCPHAESLTPAFAPFPGRSPLLFGAGSRSPPLA